MTTNLDARLSSYSPLVLSLFRIVFGLMFTLNGTMKLFGWPLGPSVAVGDWPFWWAGLSSCYRPVDFGRIVYPIAAFIASGDMAVAYFWRHQPNGLWP